MTRYCNVNTTLIHYCYTIICLFFLFVLRKENLFIFQENNFFIAIQCCTTLRLCALSFSTFVQPIKIKIKNLNFFCVSGHTSHKQDLSSFLFKEFDDLENMDPALAEFERNRREYINTMKRIRLENPDITPQELEVKAQAEVMNKGPKSRAYYR